MTADTIFNIVYAVGGFLVAAVPSVAMIIKAVKAKINARKQMQAAESEAEKAKLEAESAQATVDMTNAAAELIENAENLYDDVAEALKAQGKSAGPVKKDSVMSKLQAYALTKGYGFDEQYWSDKVDALVTMTKNVNKRA